MGNCTSPPKKLRKNGKDIPDLKEGEQIINYKGKIYKINVRDIYQKKQSPVQLQFNEQELNFIQKQHCSSIILDNIEKKNSIATADPMYNAHSHVKHQEFQLQHIQNSTLHARRSKYSINEIPTSNLLSPSLPKPSIKSNFD
ncbi:hypothetical protein TTHERM_00371300 (macronuclear) [Tetrahymena thermophila SB210]|uniref:Uncharacterized protein n=1 Tax=Tetrahymena thermophila (strain SB210) TaxID=312017 RepID=I7M0L0_TETTS|nr:hypothetical protein TTHERM_00371300 [Tetrahymena thermophila SB210]EAR89315.1 hypothetical protein TTHERM_00371300 [Tetrahymena thermophila SB210]|eukprot:XP_001009560.1 hypothetical protein TTHERM_00371300 [Tetrahymena thermophila SB210]